MCVRDVIFLFFFSFGVHGESVGSEVDAASAADGLSAASVRGDDGRRDSSVRFGFVFKSFPKKKKEKEKFRLFSTVCRPSFTDATLRI